MGSLVGNRGHAHVGASRLLPRLHKQLRLSLRDELRALKAAGGCTIILILERWTGTGGMAAGSRPCGDAAAPALASPGAYYPMLRDTRDLSIRATRNRARPGSSLQEQP